MSLVRENSKAKLRRITVKVQANKSTYSMYVFDSKMALPIDFIGVHSTSAAIPAFHPSPIEDKSADVKYGSTVGKYSDESIFLPEIL